MHVLSIKSREPAKLGKMTLIQRGVVQISIKRLI
jgi:hypothetical protein